MGFLITERDYKIMHEITRWKFLLGRQIRVLGGFSGQRACDRRIRKLIDAGYIEGRHYIYGIPRLYFVTRKAVQIFGLGYYTPSVRLDAIIHDIAVIDTAIYVIDRGVDSKSIVTERDLRNRAGFGRARHFPDFYYVVDNTTYCVEVEMSEKSVTALAKNIKSNYTNYDIQRYFIPSDKVKIIENVERLEKDYPNIAIIPLEEVTEYVRDL